jgi:3-hydroxyacyl-CoA dehydrogenase
MPCLAGAIHVTQISEAEIPGAGTEAAEAIARFIDRELGTSVVGCDTPSFIANRVVCFWIACAVAEAMARGLTVEEADAVIGAPIGAPQTGVFGLMDMVGIPLFAQLAVTFRRLLPPDDPWRALSDHSALLERMTAKGLTGRAAGGFYRLDGSKKLALELNALEYRPAREVLPPAASGVRGLVEQRDLYGDYARAVLAKTLAYAARLVPDGSESVSQIDLAVQLGFGWRNGPFALADELGPAWLARQLPDAELPRSLAAAVRAGRFLAKSTNDKPLPNQEMH